MASAGFSLRAMYSHGNPTSLAWRTQNWVLASNHAKPIAHRRTAEEEVRRLSDSADLRKELNALKKDLAALRGDVTTLSETSASTAREGIQAIMDAAKEATAQAREKITQEAEHLADKVRQGAQDVAQKAKQTGTAALEEVEQQVRERPLTSVLTALGVGFVVGMLVTRR